MCNCINEMGDLVKGRISEQVVDGGEIEEFDTGWHGRSMSLSDGKAYVMMKYNFAYRAKKKNGEMAKNLTRLDISVKMSYCPFCGVKYD